MDKEVVTAESLRTLLGDSGGVNAPGERSFTVPAR